jgi:hypothetical protein
MPRLCQTSPLLSSVVAAQDFVMHRDELIALGYTAGAIKHRLVTGQWSLLLPDVYLTHGGEPSRRQMLVAASLFAGPQSAIDGVDACRFHGMRSIAVEDHLVHVVVPNGAAARSRGFVVVRRTAAEIRTLRSGLLRYVDPASAAIAAARRMGSDRSVLAVLSEVLQRGLTTFDELVAAHMQGPPRNTRRTDRALEQLGVGVRSVAEADFVKLVTTSAVLPVPECNALLRLQTRRLVCVDALFRSSAVIHETNGRVAHAREDLFEDMQERHDALVAAGFVVLHNSPRRIRARGRDVLVELERAHARYDGRGLPDGVEVLVRAT